MRLSIFGIMFNYIIFIKTEITISNRFIIYNKNMLGIFLLSIFINSKTSFTNLKDLFLNTIINISLFLK